MSSQLQKIPLTGLPILNSTTDLIVSTGIRCNSQNSLPRLPSGSDFPKH